MQRWQHTRECPVLFCLMRLQDVCACACVCVCVRVCVCALLCVCVR